MSWLPLNPLFCWQITLTLLHVSWVGLVIGLIALLANRLLRNIATHRRYGLNFVSLLFLKFENCAIQLDSPPKKNQMRRLDGFGKDRGGNKVAETMLLLLMLLLFYQNSKNGTILQFQ